MYKTFETRIIDLFKKHNKQVMVINIELCKDGHKYIIIFKQVKDKLKRQFLEKIE